ncbi:MAG: hypothetical protein J1F40_07760 [Prevotellaceae bacterium]|nr:hypothetical protein [Prevotellaceae bacterium]
MKRFILTFSFFSLLFTLSIAQPKFISKVQKGIFSINTYDKQGNLLRQGTGFYVGANGEAMASYSIFKNAYKATVIDANGGQSEVDYVLGADDTYSVVRFHVNTKGNAVLTAATAPQSIGTQFYAVGYANKGTSISDNAAVVDTAIIQSKYIYYGLGKSLDSKLVGSPVFNESGNVVGILHPTIGNKSFVLDIRFREQLKMDAIPSRSASVALGNIFIPKGLPDTQEEALVYLYFKSKNASNEEYMDMINRFVASYPHNAEGYLRRSTPLIDLMRFDEADKDLQKYLSLVEDKAVGNFNVASIIYDKLQLQPEPAYDKWTWDVALQYVDKAISLNETKPSDEEQKTNDYKYKILKAQILDAKQDFNSSLAIYEALHKERSNIPSLYYAISVAREGRGDSLSAVIEPLDSAIAMFGTPMPYEAADYVIRRGQMYANAEKYREAVQDYNQYCYLLNNKVSAVFYYERSQIEVNARMFQQALDDINKAIEMSPQIPLYHVEKAALAIRVNLLDDCIQACQNAIRLNPNIIDAYRILGYAQLQKGDKENAHINLQKAVDMGDEGAKKILETYMH